ncbi:MAG: hypothetical protein H6701_03665 [Myxococcales bacterium]|nr:hypothetical protein [Myxococcales bacterium]
MPMQTGAAALGLLRSQPAFAIAAYGFISRGNCLSDLVGGAATLNCARHGLSSIYEITVTAGGTDFYIPFRQGKALYCDVPRGQPNGTLVVTYPMNGCALEVHRQDDNTLRFFHDSDGKHMPLVMGGHRARVFRKTYSDYAGRDETTLVGMERERDRAERKDLIFTGNFEHNIYCVKVGTKWEVHASAVVLSRVFNQNAQIVSDDAWQIKHGVPYKLGSFDD